MKIAVVDSGIATGHVHVGGIAGGVSFAGGDDPVDRMGHGTAVAGAIRQWAPEAEIYAVKIFDTRLTASIEPLLRALEWCGEHGMDIVNLSLGTANEEHRERLTHAVRRARLVVSPVAVLPGSLVEAVGVAVDAECPRERFRYAGGVFYGSPYPRPIPGVPVERNLSGVSFAVANVTGLAAAAGCRTREDLVRKAAE